MQIIGISVTLSEPPKGPITLKLLINDKNTKQNLSQQGTNDPSGTPKLDYRWDLSPFLSLHEGKELMVQIVRKKTFTSRILAEGSINYSDMAMGGSSSGYQEYVISHDPIIRVEVAPVSNDAALGLILDAALDLTKQRQSALDHLGKVRGFLETLLQYSTALSELDPLAKALLGCVNIVYARLESNERVDRLIYQLADSMAMTLGYIQDVEQFARVTQLRRAIEEVRPLIEDATNLIVSFTSRSATAQFLYSTDATEEIESLDKRFARFKEQFDRGVAVNTGVTVETVLEGIINMKDQTILQQLRPRGIGGILATECILGTRRDVLVDVDEWLNNFDLPNILLIRGFPGVGKSSLAATVVNRLRSLHRLGSHFAFERAKAAVTTPSALWRMVAYDIAHLFPSVRRIVLSKLEEEIVDVHLSDDKILFQNLIEEPLKKSTDISPEQMPVIVIDALDECGGLDGRHSRHRASLLTTLRRWARLPSQFKLIVTSRSEDDIVRTLSPLACCIEIHSGTTVCEEDIHDIYIFLEQEFKEIASEYSDSLDPDWPGPERMRQLADHAAGLFIWATTVTNFVSLGEPENQLQQILSGNAGLGDMTSLYAKILDTSFQSPTEEVLDAFQTITGAIIGARYPLRCEDYLALLDVQPSMLDFVRKGLRSVTDDGDVLSFSHQSFVDFLLDPHKCPPQFVADIDQQERRLALATLRVMRRMLHFNICSFSTSHCRNTDVEDLEARVAKAIPTHLVYSCQYWAGHLSGTWFDQELLFELKDFMEDRFLYWLEVLSVTNTIYIVVPSLNAICHWVKNYNSDVLEFAKDGLKFMAAFGTVIAQSAPHIYLSALPFAPLNSKVAQQYLPSYPQALVVETGRVSDWPAIQLIIDEHYGHVNSIACSSDGRFIGSGSADKTALILNAETGQPVSGPFRGHESSVNCVAFFESLLLASGSDDQTIRIWDVETGDLIAGPLIGHTDMITALTFLPGGKLISGSNDKTLRIWDSQEGVTALGPLRAHTLGVTCLAVSSDESRVASGSYDKTIYLWDPTTGDTVAGPFIGHTSWINAVAFSPNSQFVASASDDETLYIWHADDGTISVGPLDEHTDSVTSVAFSPTDSIIVSGSHDETLRLWDANTGKPVRGPYRGHTDGVICVAFSVDGRRIISGSRDQTIRVWDAWPGQDDTEGILGYTAHKDGVNAVAVCEERGLIVSGSDDDAVMVWDMNSGELFAGPLEGHDHWVQAVAFTPQGDRVISGSEDQTIRVWSLDDGQQVLCMEGHRAGVTSLAVSSNGCIISGSYDGTVKVWDLSTGELLLSNGEHRSWVTCVAASHSNGLFASGSHDKTIRIWSLDEAQSLPDPIEGHTGPVNCISFSPDGQLLASGAADLTIRVWDVSTGKAILGPWHGHAGLITSVAFTPDGQYIISSAYDKTIRIWDVETGVAVCGPFNGHTGGICEMICSPSGTRIISCSDDESIRVWNAEALEEVIEEDPDDADLAALPVEFSSYSKLTNGWVSSTSGALLFWVPPWHRNGLWWPRTSVVICERPTKLSFSQFVHGESWEHVKSMLHPVAPPSTRRIVSSTNDSL